MCGLVKLDKLFLIGRDPQILETRAQEKATWGEDRA